MIKKGSEDRVRAFRSHIYSKSIQQGENLMPSDVAEIMKKSRRGGKFKNIDSLMNNRAWYMLFVDVYTSCGFVFPEEEEEFSIENYQTYF